MTTTLYEPVLPYSGIDPTRTASWGGWVGTVGFIAATWFLLAPLHPFPDLVSSGNTTAWETGDSLNQVVYISIAAVLALLVVPRYFAALRSALTFPLGLAIASLLLSVVFSQNVELSLRRFGFTMVVMIIAWMWLLVPLGMRHFSVMLGAVVGAIILVCFIGVGAAPWLAVHQSQDLVEPALAGDWRGMFAHKNEAGAVMALFVFIGLFVAAAANVAAGTVIAIAASAFLFFTSAKTSLILLPLVLVVSHVAMRARHLAWKTLVCLGPLLVLATAIVIACYSAATDDVLKMVLPDTSFTGRTDVWRFAIDHALERPITGYGFMAFWRTSAVMSVEVPRLWANVVAHSHNGYLDVALTTGLPGLASTFLFIVVMPLINFHKRVEGEANRVLSLLFLRFWLFGIYVNCFESALFDRSNQIWFLLLSASFGLHFLARYRIRP
jgi:O-antigen ligase